MAIEDIFRALEEQGEQEVRDILDTAREQAKGIEADAAAQAERIRSTKIDVAKANVESRTARVTNAAQLEARRTVAAVKERAIVTAYDGALGRLETLRSSSGYAEMFRALLAEALEGLEGDVTVLVDPADADLASATLAALGRTGTIDTGASTHGGMTVVANNGTMFRRNTVEDRLDKYRSAGQTAVAEALFV